MLVSEGALRNREIAPENRIGLSIKPYAIVLIFGVFLVFAWVAWTSSWDSGLYGDSVEQFVWAHSLELGYYKHPPFPTWLFGAATYLVGSHWWLANAVAALCISATGVLTWLIARHLCGERVANISIVLWSLQQCFSVSAEIYNHNTVLVLCMSATTYAVIRALTSRFDTPWWIAGGCLAACAMLTKYQAALPLGALLIVVFAVGRTRTTQLAWRMVLVFLVFFLLFSPHLYWGITNRFPSLRYASEVLESGGLAQRAFWVATFAVNQIRMILPLLLAITICFFLARFHRQNPIPNPRLWPRQENASSAAFNDRETSIWIWSLVWGPILVLLAASLLTGSALRNHWGVQLFQFFSIWVAWRWRNSTALNPRNLMVAALLVHALGLTYYAIKQSNPDAVLADRRADSAYPAQKISDAAVAHWKRATDCPLRIIVGDFEAGLTSAYSKEAPVVFTSPMATPWVKPGELEQYGALYVFDKGTALPADVTAVMQWPLVSGAAGNEKYVQFAVRLPKRVCATTPSM
ncbi:ArnT family glycosyltransferase [Polaromonas sp.]|uniref:ArnT family glycosyltransferase n=1 Tax=Polaromonas sp. TaxID=1869339 RepID=UPI003BAD2A51